VGDIFFNRFGGTLYGPGGNMSTGSGLTAFGGISSNIGPQGPLVGVFSDFGACSHGSGRTNVFALWRAKHT
jgi:hypothetical protein